MRTSCAPSPSESGFSGSVPKTDSSWSDSPSPSLSASDGAGPHFGEEDPLVGSNGSGTIFMSSCNLRCVFCQNYDISTAKSVDRLADRASPEALARAAKAHGCASVAYTYNDPVIFLEYAVDVAKECRKLDIKNVAVTAGYVCPEPRAEFYRHMDAANIDLKAFSERFYHKICHGQLQPVLETLLYLK